MQAKRLMERLLKLGGSFGKLTLITESLLIPNCNEEIFQPRSKNKSHYHSHRVVIKCEIGNKTHKK
jgi:hypothetical protein